MTGKAKARKVFEAMAPPRLCRKTLRMKRWSRRRCQHRASWELQQKRLGGEWEVVAYRCFQHLSKNITKGSVVGSDRPDSFRYVRMMKR